MNSCIFVARSISVDGRMDITMSAEEQVGSEEVETACG